jgi:hypothetical protein
LAIAEGLATLRRIGWINQQQRDVVASVDTQNRPLMDT